MNNIPKNSSTFSNKSKSGIVTDDNYLMGMTEADGDANNVFLMAQTEADGDANNVFLLVDSASTSASWNNLTKGFLTPDIADQSYDINWTGATNSSINLIWTEGAESETLVLAQEGVTTISDLPNKGETYTANATYGSGDKVGDSYVVYNGTNTAVNITGLSSRTRYCFRLFNYDSSTKNYNWTKDLTYVERYRNTSL